MFEFIKSGERGKTNMGWLESYHSFSFGEFNDPNKIHFGPLRVLNDDFVKPGEGFPTHPHNDMEIITIVTKGEIAHKDSEGNKKVISKNEIQRMTAGRGIFHSEFNNSNTEILKLFQIWIFPNAKGLEPDYQQVKFSAEQRKNRLQKVVSGRKDDDIIFINQDADIYLSDLEAGNKIDYSIKESRGVYLHSINGDLNVSGYNLETGDALKISSENLISIIGVTNSRFMLFDLPMKF